MPLGTKPSSDILPSNLQPNLKLKIWLKYSIKKSDRNKSVSYNADTVVGLTMKRKNISHFLLDKIINLTFSWVVFKLVIVSFSWDFDTVVSLSMKVQNNSNFGTKFLIKLNLFTNLSIFSSFKFCSCVFPIGHWHNGQHMHESEKQFKFWY